MTMNKPLKRTFDHDKTFYSIHPKEFAALNSLYGFTVDGCADAWNHVLDNYWTDVDDCLSQDWNGERIWLHPPYEDQQLVHGILDRMMNSEADLAVMLVAGWSIDNSYWRKLAASPCVTVELAKLSLPFLAPGFPPYSPEYPLFLIRST